MKKSSLVISLCLLSIFCNNTFAQKSLKKGSTAFSFSLYKKISKGEKSNIFFSPLSLSSSFAIPYTGARNLTKTQLKSVFHYDNDQAKNLEDYTSLLNNLETTAEDPTQFDIVNNLWLNNGFPLKEGFKQAMQGNLQANFQYVDFSNNKEDAVREINNSIAEQTQQSIRNLLSPKDINAMTKFVVTNALYFKGNWKTKFDQELTASHDFFLSDEDKFVSTLFMTKKMSGHGYYEDHQVQVVELPYEGNRFSMLVILPRDVAGLKRVESSLSYKTYKKWLKNMSKQSVLVTLPKFKLTQKYKMRRYFRNMDCTIPFMDHADFTGMTKQQVKLSEVIQKAHIAVDEEGTVASAATAIMGMQKGIEVSSKYFKADHPFLFLIKDNKTDVILFMGRMMHPKVKELQNYTTDQPYRFEKPNGMKGDGTHTVQKGETLFKISKQYQTHISKLKRLNKLKTNTLEVGQILVIYKTKRNETEPLEIIERIQKPIDSTIESDKAAPHIVQKGETLFKIAKKYKTSVDVIKALNQLETNTIEIGQELLVRHKLKGQHKGISAFRSRKKETIQIQTMPKQTTEMVVVEPEINTEINLEVKPEGDEKIACNCKKHTVRKGETLFRLATQYDTTVAQIKFINQLDSNTLEVGQKLMIEKVSR